jgi:hypothetical protein
MVSEIRAVVIAWQHDAGLIVMAMIAQRSRCNHVRVMQCLEEAGAERERKSRR